MTTIRYAVTGSRSLCAVAHDLIQAGHAPDTLVTWTRNDIPIFTIDRPLRWWAERTVEEGSGLPRLRNLRNPRRAGYKPATPATRPSDGSPYPDAPGGRPDATSTGEDGE